SRNRAREGVDGAPEKDASNTARLLDLLPSDPDAAILVRGQALRDLGRFAEARSVYERMAEAHAWRQQLLDLAHGGSRAVVVLTPACAEGGLVVGDILGEG